MVGHPEKLIDFEERAVHEMTVAAKAVAAAYYGSAPQKAYFNGCSTGGRQAVQRMFQPGEEQTFEVHNEIVLTAGDAGGVAVMVNGAPAKPLGAGGQAVTTRINLTNFKDYLLTP